MGINYKSSWGNGGKYEVIFFIWNRYGNGDFHPEPCPVENPRQRVYEKFREMSEAVQNRS